MRLRVHLNGKSRRLKFLLLIVLLLVCATLMFARWKTPAAKSANAQADATDRLEAELITAIPIGFEPAEITRPQGRFMQAVDNRSGLEDLDLFLERETGSRVNVSLGRKGAIKPSTTYCIPIIN